MLKVPITFICKKKDEEGKTQRVSLMYLHRLRFKKKCKRQQSINNHKQVVFKERAHRRRINEME